MSLCASVYICFVVTCWERTDLLALVCGVYYEFVTFPLVSWVNIVAVQLEKDDPCICCFLYYLTFGIS